MSHEGNDVAPNGLAKRNVKLASLLNLAVKEVTIPSASERLRVVKVAFENNVARIMSLIMLPLAGMQTAANMERFAAIAEYELTGKLGRDPFGPKRSKELTNSNDGNIDGDI